MNHKSAYLPVLSIAGSDSGGGAGIQADLKTFAALGCYGMTVICAVTAQNTVGVAGIYNLPAAFIKQQFETVLADLIPKAIKIGMLSSVAAVSAVAEVLRKYPHIPVVLDPVMRSTSGEDLMKESLVHAMVTELFPLATLVTPNLHEAALLTQQKVETTADMQKAGHLLMEKGCNALLLKGGHLNSDTLTSFFFSSKNTVASYLSKRILTKNTHGTGCTLSSAIAAYLAQDYPLVDAVRLGQDYVYQAILKGEHVQIGKGHGPLNHFFDPKKAIIK